MRLLSVVARVSARACPARLLGTVTLSVVPLPAPS